MVLVTYARGKVCVDVYEARIQGWPHSHALDGRDAGALRAIVAKAAKPQVNVNALQAEAACANASKRLCTATEWVAACRGPRNFVYPYGNTYRRGACNEGRPSPTRAVFGSGWGRHDDPRLAEADNAIEPGGAFPACVSGWGVYDMHGNVHEWVSDSAKDARFGVFLGGFFADGTENGFGCGYRTTAHFKDYHDYSTGFRCCKDSI